MKKYISGLEKARSEYKPKLPNALKQGINSLILEKGALTTAEADMEDIKEIFPNLYGAPVITFGSGTAELEHKTINAGVILSGSGGA